MRDRWEAVAFAVGLGVFCGLGFALGHRLHEVGIAVTIGAVLVAVLAAVAALRHVALVRGVQRWSLPSALSGIPVRVGRIGDATFVAGRQWLASTEARREVTADGYALATGAGRGELASALLKLPPLARAHVTGFTPAIDLRLQAPLGDLDDVAIPALLRVGGMLLLGGLAAATTCTWLLHRLLAATL